MLVVLFGLNAWSSSKREISPVEASSCPTGREVAPRLARLLLILKSITLLEISTTSLGDISIRSNLESNLFMVSTTIRIPRTF